MGPTLTDPEGSNVLVAAMLWLQHTLLGTIAMTIAIVAVAWVGFLMLSGRLPYRHGMTVVAGCFVLFGAPGIAAGIQYAAGMGGARPSVAPSVAADADASPIVIPPEPPGSPAGYDPYAGASVPAA